MNFVPAEALTRRPRRRRLDARPLRRHRRPTTTTRRTRMKSMVPLGTLSRLAQALML
ncbi:hypothetical protein HMPREF9619_01289 [Cutibacterium acnes HL082PA2]|nr:hypothetical protein HMPREF9619_01289 [Cutibacterium acnes HL082PA2]